MYPNHQRRKKTKNRQLKRDFKMTELEKYQEQNKAQTLQIIQLMQEIEDLKAKLEGQG